MQEDTEILCCMLTSWESCMKTPRFWVDANFMGIGHKNTEILGCMLTSWKSRMMTLRSWVTC